ncbi:DUF839 domain-containing protein [Thermoleophilia bacterium SCSIO 60948]|nr:DUF839 domain-containing protein [Thermoleophilia bacterium SCSIO 60948]
MEPNASASVGLEAELDSEAPQRGKLSGHTRRNFIAGIAAAGVSTAATAVANRGNSLFGENALAAGGGRNGFASFEAIAPSPDDRFNVPKGYRADILISWNDTFRDGNGQALRYGFNNDFLAYFPIDGSKEGLIFVNHEYPDPFFLHGYKGSGAKTEAQVQEEKDSVGNAILHVKRRPNGVYRIVQGSDYNRRVYGDRPGLTFTGPLAGTTGVGDSARGSLGNCSGGITPWGTALSCEENYEGYGQDTSAGGYGWDQYGGQPGDEEYDPVTHAKYGWVCEHDPFDPDSTGRKHTALGRFRHENTAFRHEPGKKFVLYMGDDKTNEGVYKFVSSRRFKRGDRANNRRILTEGQLYIARWEPEGRRRFATKGDVEPITDTEGTGTWVEVTDEQLRDTAALIRAAVGTEEYNTHFATNRPEDVEVGPDGSVYIALTNNSTVNDSHGSVRRLREAGNDPEATSFRWSDFAAGGPQDQGGAGFSSPDNLVFDSENNVWVVTDISSSALNSDNEYGYHANNAIFMVPTRGENRGVAFRFANGPVEAECTGPYFSPDERSLFVNIQHPGELTAGEEDSVFGIERTYTSWWPEGNRTAEENPSLPHPSTVVITKDPRGEGERSIPPARRRA